VGVAAGLAEAGVASGEGWPRSSEGLGLFMVDLLGYNIIDSISIVPHCKRDCKEILWWLDAFFQNLIVLISL
jgi:hypothetical protein